MSGLKNQIQRIIDLKQQRDIKMHRYYTREDQIVILDLIIKELDTWSEGCKVPYELLIELLSPEKYAQYNIESLCLLYGKTVIEKQKIELKGENLT